MRIAVMQPTYLPWVGYFSLIHSVDAFIILDDVEFSRQSWQQRNRIKTAQGFQWLSIPVRLAGKGRPLINEVEIDQAQPWKRKHLSAILMNYAPAPYLLKYKALLEEIYHSPWENLCVLNSELIKRFCAELNIRTPLVFASSLQKKTGRVDRLISICKTVGATEYVSPLGSFGYIDSENHFKESGIKLTYQHYVPSIYQQLHGDFVSYLSVIDVLLNHGPETLSIIRAGEKVNYTPDEARLVSLENHKTNPADTPGV